MKLMYSNIVIGDRLWFVKKGSKFIGIRISFDTEAWSPFYYESDGELPEYLQGGYEAESKRDYYNVLKTIFEKERIG